MYCIITTAAAEERAWEKTLVEFEGFLKGLDSPEYKGVIKGVGAGNKGDIKSSPAMKEAFETGKNM